MEERERDREDGAEREGEREREENTHTVKGRLDKDMGWLRLLGSLKLYVSFAKEPYKRDLILRKRPIFLRSLLIAATP